MFNSEAYMGLFRELLANVKTEGILEKDWCNVPMVKWHALGETSINTTEEEARYSRTYVTELASQFREEEFILRIKLKGSGVQFQVGFSTDVSESCIWLTPFIKPSEDMSDVRQAFLIIYTGIKSFKSILTKCHFIQQQNDYICRYLLISTTSPLILLIRDNLSIMVEYRDLFNPSYLSF